METTAKSLRLNTKNILDAVERGEEVIISKRGKACARIVPIKKKNGKSTIQNTGLYGIWKENKAVQNVEAFIDSLRSGRE